MREREREREREKALSLQKAYTGEKPCEDAVRWWSFIAEKSLKMKPTLLTT